MPTLTAKQLREERAVIGKQIRDMADLVNEESRDFTPEEQPKWESLNKDYDQYTARIDIAERAERVAYEQEETIERQRENEERKRRDNIGREDADHRDSSREERREERPKPQVTEQHRSLALQAWMRAQYDIPLEARHTEACELTGVRPHSRDFSANLRHDIANVRREFRALSGVSDTAGAYTIAEGFVNNIESSMLAFGGMRQMSDIIRTDSGNNLPWPTSDDTSNKGVLIGENQTVAEQDVTFGQVVFQAYKYSSKLVKVPRELLEDSQFDLASWLGQKLGERIGRICNDHFTTGDGAGKPKGIVTASGLGKTAASATAIAADELYDLLHSVDPAYRSGSSVAWMMHDNILLVIRKLKDGNGQYLWQPGLTAREPDRLLGYPIVINQSMQSSVASATKTVLFGDMSKYKIRDVAGFRLRRLVERYADADQDGFLAFTRHDGNLLDAGTDPVKHLLQAT